MTSIDLQEERGQPRAGEKAGEPGRGYKRAALAVLPIPAVGGFLLSWAGMYDAAHDYFPSRWAASILPAMVDLTILVASLFWVAGMRRGRQDIGWRLLAHAGVAASVYLNGRSGFEEATHGGWKAVPWHVVAPLIWSAFVELLAKDQAGLHEQDLAQAGQTVTRLTLRLWLVRPRQSFRTWLRMQQTGERDADAARVQADRCRTAVLALREKLPHHRRHRRLIRGRLASGALPPGHVLDAVGWTGDGTADPVRSGDSAAAAAVVRAAFRSVLEPSAASSPSGTGGRVDAQADAHVDGSVDGRVDAQPDGSVDAWTPSTRTGTDGTGGRGAGRASGRPSRNGGRRPSTARQPSAELVEQAKADVDAGRLVPPFVPTGNLKDLYGGHRQKLANLRDLLEAHGSGTNGHGHL